jgi:hypothetical protein
MFSQKVKAEVKVGCGNGGQGLDKNLDNNRFLGQSRIELIATEQVNETSNDGYVLHLQLKNGQVGFQIVLIRFTLLCQILLKNVDILGIVTFNTINHGGNVIGTLNWSHIVF